MLACISLSNATRISVGDAQKLLTESGLRCVNELFTFAALFGRWKRKRKKCRYRYLM